MRRNRRFQLVIICFLLFAVLLSVISLGLGSYKIPPIRVLQVLLGDGSKLENITIFQIRLPRIFIALAVGTALAVSGAILQGITRNDLADPGILGVNSGASLAVVLFIEAGKGSYYSELGTLSVFALPFVAMIGAYAAAALVYLLTWKNGINPVRFILMGVGVGGGLNALITLYQLNFQQQDFNRVLVWISGSLWGSTWKYLYAVVPVILILLVLTLHKMRHLDILNLGDELASGLGIQVEKERMKLIRYAVSLAGCAAAVAGSIGFLGLISPHIARKLVGPRHRRLIPAACFISCCIILFADLISRNLFAPVEIPVGITISLIGVPYFIYLMLRGDSNV